MLFEQTARRGNVERQKDQAIKPSENKKKIKTMTLAQ
jgi:hypothetical protein